MYGLWLTMDSVARHRDLEMVIIVSCASNNGGGNETKIWTEISFK